MKKKKKHLPKVQQNIQGKQTILNPYGGNKEQINDNILFKGSK